MAKSRRAQPEEDLESARRYLDQLLKNPAAFEKWANETLDMSRMRRR